MEVTKVRGDHPLWVLDAVLTPEECVEFIALANATKDDADGSRAWHVPDNNPGIYMRATRVDPAIADRLWDRIRPVLPARYNGYRLTHVNRYIRFSWYRNGGRFPIHRDGKKYEVAGPDKWAAETLFTLNIFLNAGFEGGQTDFFGEGKPQGGRLPGPAKLRISVEPKPGRAALFWAEQLHRGNVVRPTAAAEFKYLMRTDVFGVRE